MPLAVIALGSNLGDRERNLDAAVARLRELGSVMPSSHYETAPMYLEDQPPFLNAALLLECQVGPFALLRRLKHLEAEIGRQARQRNGPREIDLDLIIYGCLQLESDRLKLPHPRLAERRFVLAPLAEIAPHLIIPGQGQVADLLAATDHQSDHVRRIALGASR